MILNISHACTYVKLEISYTKLQVDRHTDICVRSTHRSQEPPPPAGVSPVWQVPYPRTRRKRTPLEAHGLLPLGSCVGSRDGWEFHHATQSGSTWTLEDNITFTLPGHTEENPVWYVESMREAISEAYHIMWRRHYQKYLKDQKDDEAGMKLSRSNPKPKK